MFIKSVSRLNQIMLLVCLVSAVVLVGAVPVRARLDWGGKAAHAADVPAGIAAGDVDIVAPDRISFYNVPTDDKLESHLDYADGRTETIEYPAALCAAGTVITHTLNLYMVTFVADGCEATVFQQLNLRWLGGCRFEFEHDPDARMVARGPYGEIVIAEGHYPASELELTNLPANTTTLSATMTHTDEQGHVLTGNVAFSFHEPHPGCGPAPTPTSTPTPTATDIPPDGSSPTDTPTVAPTATSTLEASTGLDPIDEPGASTTSTVYLPFVVK